MGWSVFQSQTDVNISTISEVELNREEEMIEFFS